MSFLGLFKNSTQQIINKNLIHQIVNFLALLLPIPLQNTLREIKPKLKTFFLLETNDQQKPKQIIIREKSL